MKNATAFVLAFCLTTAIAFAADKIDVKSLDQKTLPSAIYDRLKEGKRTSLFWRDSSFTLNSPYSLEKVEWLAAERNGSLLDSLTRGMESVSKNDGALYRVQMRVTTYVPAAIKKLSKNVQPRIIVEAVVLDKNGTPVAAMVTSEKGDLGVHPKADAETFNGMADKVISAFDSEVMKAR